MKLQSKPMKVSTILLLVGAGAVLVLLVILTIVLKYKFLR